MKQYIFLFGLLCCTHLLGAEEQVRPPRVGTVNFKECLEKSKFGKQEQARFEQMKRKLEQSIEQKEKELNEMSPKFSDEYLDSLTPEAEAELKEKFGLLNQEMNQMQNQYYQTLDQANTELVQKLFEMITEVSKKISEEKGLDLIINDAVCFYKSKELDVSSDVIIKLDEISEQS
jgi:outer membrane protein